MAKAKCNLSNEALWKRLDKLLLKMSKENPKYIEAQNQYDEMSDKIVEVLRKAVGHHPGFELYFWQDSSRLDMSVEELEAAYKQGYKDALKTKAVAQ